MKRSVRGKVSFPDLLVGLFFLSMFWFLFMGFSTTPKMKTSTPKDLLIYQSNKPCLYDNQCASATCRESTCATLFELSTWAERKDLIRKLIKDLRTETPRAQEAFNSILEKALPLNTKSLAGPRPRVIEALAAHTDTAKSENLLREFHTSTDLEIQLALARKNGLRGDLLQEAPGDGGSNDLLLLVADTHKSKFVALCGLKRLRRSYPSLDARCARFRCDQSDSDIVHKAVLTLYQLWECPSKAEGQL